MKKITLTARDLADIKGNAINYVRDHAYATDRDIGLIATLNSLNDFLISQGVESNFDISEEYIIGRNNDKVEK